jgi:hypothetical protein
MQGKVTTLLQVNPCHIIPWSQCTGLYLEFTGFVSIIITPQTTSPQTPPLTHPYIWFFPWKRVLSYNCSPCNTTDVRTPGLGATQHSQLYIHLLLSGIEEGFGMGLYPTLYHMGQNYTTVT